SSLTRPFVRSCFRHNAPKSASSKNYRTITYPRTHQIKPAKWTHWAREEDNKLLRMRKSGSSYLLISATIGRNRSSCYYRYRDLTQPPSAHRLRWTAEENGFLLEAWKGAEAANKRLRYTELSGILNRDPRAIRSHLCEIPPHLKKGPLNAEEQTLLRNFVQTKLKYGGHIGWVELGRLMNRSSGYLRKFWDAHSGLRTGRFDDEEDRLVLRRAKMAMKMGTRPSWAAIGRLLNRPPVTVLNRWKTAFQSRLSKAQINKLP
ncbi:hypothetical protein HK097_006146, partial [Rhizophlyctis rosea]